ncbi:MAG: energy-coupled thiamine transporter ThiT [Oscillospiraceae bacterium]|nr:energy-coupled thiamine transporter ThiT [Oscillospiraceae bacterium]
MNNTKSRQNLRALVESALLVAIGFALSFIRFTIMPQGGSVTLLSMLPLLMIGLRHGLKWGLCGGIVYAGLQMLQQIWAPPSGTVAAWAAMLALDYIVAFTVLGLSGIFRGRRYGIIYAVPLCLGLRFLSHFFSGVIIWGNYLDAASWIFSLAYNGSYMGPELVFTMIIGTILCKTAPILFNPQKSAEA